MKKQIVAVNDQKKDRLYHMKLLFKVDLAFKTINEIAEICGMSEKAMARNAATADIEQVVPFIPDNETIDKYAQVIKENYETKDLAAENVTFTGYEFLYEVTVSDLEDTESVPNITTGNITHSEG